MSRLFAVARSLGAGWNDAAGLETQEGWRAHADFMNRLHADGAVVLGGPLEGTREVLLIMRGSDAAEIAARLEGDPWSRTDLLRISRIAPWDLRLGVLL